MSRILITRPQNGDSELVLRLKNDGFEPVIEPIFDIEYVDFARNFDKNGVFAAILTSSNAISSFLAGDFDKNIRIFVIGKKTAQKLVEKGYENVVFPAEMSALALKKLILDENCVKNGKILYFCGNFITLDFASELGALGFDVEKILAYKVDYKKRFSDKFLAEIAQKKLDFVLIFSKNGAKNFYNLLKSHNLLEYFNETVILCLSEQILDEIKDFGFKNYGIFDEILTLKNFYK